MRGWLLGILLLSGCSSPGNQGARAYRAGRYQEAFRLWKPLAEQRDARAQCQLAYLYERGLGVKQDLPQAIAWYEKAAAQGNGYAENSLGQFYAREQPAKSLKFHKLAAEHGQANSQLALGHLFARQGDQKQAFHWYEKAAQQAPEGMLEVARCYLEGRGVAADSKKAFQWATRAADGQDVQAMCLLGQMYEQGRGVPKDSGAALRFYRKAAEKDSLEGHFRLASALLQSAPDEAKEHMKKAAEAGYAPAQVGMGRLALRAQDTYSAAEWFEKAAEQGVAEAEFERARLEVDRYGRDEKALENWFRQAYRHGYPKAGVELGKFYARKGLAGPEHESFLALAAEAGDQTAQLVLGKLYQDSSYSSRARGWLQRAAEQGSAEAQYRLGDLLRREGGQDSLAVGWYQRAVEQQFTPAYYSLGRMIEEGRGIGQSDEKALYYYNLAAENGVPLGFYALARLDQKFGKVYEALFWYEQAGDSGIPDGYFAMGLCYQEGQGVEKDLARARELYLRADIPDAYYALGLLCEQQKQPGDALTYFTKAGDLPEAVQARRRLAGQ